MSFKQFPQDLYANIFTTSEKLLAGRTAVRESGELKHMRLMIYNHGVSLAGEKAKVVLYPAGKTTGVFAESDEIDLTNVEENFLGFIRFDFQNINIRKLQAFDFYLELSGYTKVNGTRYFSMLWDYPNMIYDLVFGDSDKFYNHPIANEVFVYQ